MFSSLVLCCCAEMFRCVFGPLLVHLCALCVPVHLYELYMIWYDMIIEWSQSRLVCMEASSSRSVGLQTIPVSFWIPLLTGCVHGRQSILPGRLGCRVHERQKRRPWTRPVNTNFTGRVDGLSTRPIKTVVSGSRAGKKHCTTMLFQLGLSINAGCVHGVCRHYPWTRAVTGGKNACVYR